MRISFNIPTYNRAKYLKQNLDILTAQIKELHKEEEVEINISDNASTDETKQVSEACIAANPKLHISYHCNEKNLGPDGNFIAAMHLAKGEYSLLWGDDDFLKEGGLARIFELVEYGKQNDVQIMLSSTSVYDKYGNHKGEKPFLREDIKELTTDFSDLTQARAYFFLLKDMGGMLSFISDVVYKTSIINEIPLDQEFMGTHYAFLCYWWGWLAKGKKLYYCNQSFLKETVQYQPAYGFGVKRSLIDFDGYLLIANKLLYNNKWNVDFKQALMSVHNILRFRNLYALERTAFQTQMAPKMSECGVTDGELKEFYKSCDASNILKSLVIRILPENLVYKLKNKKMK